MPAETPVMTQFADAKRRFPDALLFFRMGDFYELFYDDARVASEALGLTLTARDKDRTDKLWQLLARTDSPYLEFVAGAYWSSRWDEGHTA